MIKISVELTGTRPLMFDRYAGDNATKLKPEDKFYLSDGGALILPALNIYSLLTAENTPSVPRVFGGKAGKTVASGIKANVSIEPMDIPILGEEDAPLVWRGEWKKPFTRHLTVARVPKGIPNPKDRPMLDMPWKLRFTLDYRPNKECSLPTLLQYVEDGGRLGLGTYRPFFGQYEVSSWEEMNR